MYVWNKGLRKCHVNMYTWQPAQQSSLSHDVTDLDMLLADNNHSGTCTFVQFRRFEVRTVRYILRSSIGVRSIVWYIYMYTIPRPVGVWCDTLWNAVEVRCSWSMVHVWLALGCHCLPVYASRSSSSADCWWQRTLWNTPLLFTVAMMLDTERSRQFTSLKSPYCFCADLERNLSLRTTRDELIRRGVLKDVDETTQSTSQQPEQPSLGTYRYRTPQV